MFIYEQRSLDYLKIMYFIRYFLFSKYFFLYSFHYLAFYTTEFLTKCNIKLKKSKAIKTCLQWYNFKGFVLQRRAVSVLCVLLIFCTKKN